jgi:hypothetical protein
VVSGFRRELDQICSLLRYYTAYSGNSLQTYWDNLFVPYSKVQTVGRWDPQVFPKRRQGITTICCVIPQKSAHLNLICPVSFKVGTLKLTFCAFSCTFYKNFLKIICQKIISKSFRYIHIFVTNVTFLMRADIV